MKKIIVIAGATGNLGGKIVNALLPKEAELRAIVRMETDIKTKPRGLVFLCLSIRNRKI